MTPITLHVNVWKNEDYTDDAEPWCASVYASGTGGSRSRSKWCPSWAEAMQAAQKIRRDLDTELMNEVHESRARRRAAEPSAPILATDHMGMRGAE